MATENTVTISVEEYFDLRQKAEMNAFLIAELHNTDRRFRQYDDILFRLEDEVRRLKNG
jgi:hypothetical protein